MSDVMLFGVLGMPYEMAMADDLTRFQFYQRVSDLVCKYKALELENSKLKEFVIPILAHGDECVGDWDGGELQDLAVKSGLYIEKTMTEPCNLGKEEFVACPCREYCYGDDSWECYRIANFLLEDGK